MRMGKVGSHAQVDLRLSAVPTAVPSVYGGMDLLKTERKLETHDGLADHELSPCSL